MKEIDKLAPLRRESDRGYKAKAVCLDGPAAPLAIGRHVDHGEKVAIRVSVENEAGGRITRTAIYESVGECAQVPKADGVGLKFVGFENEPK